MRVLAGSWRGRNLTAAGAGVVRPTTARVKAAMFSILGDRLPGAELADLCCGAGGLGIEALSRGAAYASFVDISGGALRAVLANLKRCGAPTGSFGLHRKDARRWLEARCREPVERPLLVVADPPYGSPMVELLIEVALKAPADLPLRAAIIEAGTADFTAPPAKGRLRGQVRRYGTSTLIILEA